MKKKSPYISVIMPVYNAEAYLRTSVESVLGQTFEDLELILVNDCSSDGSAQICAEYEKKDPRVVFVNLRENVGAGHARNQGIARAGGVYLSFVDADDVIDRDLYECAVKQSKEGKADMVVWGVTEVYYGRDGQPSSRNVISPEQGYWDEKETIAGCALRLEEMTLLGYQWNKLYRREIVEENQIEFEKAVLYEDYFFTMRVLAQISSLAVCAKPGYYYAKRLNGSVTNRFVKEYFSLSRRRIQEMYDYCVEHGVENEAREVLGNIYLRYILSAMVRNLEKQSKMNGKAREKWICAAASDKLYMRTAAKCTVTSRSLRILRNAMNRKHFTVCVILARGVYMAKKAGPFLFERLKAR